MSNTNLNNKKTTLLIIAFIYCLIIITQLLNIDLLFN